MWGQAWPAGVTGLFVTGMVSSAVVGYLTVKYFIRYLADHALDVFARIVWFWRWLSSSCLSGGDTICRGVDSTGCGRAPEERTWCIGFDAAS